MRVVVVVIDELLRERRLGEVRGEVVALPVEHERLRARRAAAVVVRRVAVVDDCVASLFELLLHAGARATAPTMTTNDHDRMRTGNLRSLT